MLRYQHKWLWRKLQRKMKFVIAHCTIYNQTIYYRRQANIIDRSQFINKKNWGEPNKQFMGRLRKRAN